MKNDLIYLYCATDMLPFPGQSIESHRLKYIRHDNFYLIVRDVPQSEFSEQNLKRNLSDIHWLKIMADEHVSIINKVMEFNRAFPFKFGTVFESEERLRNFFDDCSGSIIENFSHPHGYST